MRELILNVHTSLDGFVAGQKGELDDFDAGDENMEFICKLTEDADSALFGRISYQLLESFWPTARDLPNATKSQIRYSNWYNSAKKIVITRSLAGTGLSNTTIISGDILNEITRIKGQTGRNILIFGSPAVAQLLMRFNLIDSYWIFINPLILGKGIPLFNLMEDKIRLRLITTRQFSNGEIAINYRVIGR